ncbi:MAG: HNH endonuclease [Gammaproteobacteria bacterium]|nr:HNH endonuclease [Gammaproteobacteria bacterium]
MHRLFVGVALFASTSVADPTWRGLIVADEDRCAPYDRAEYRYPASVEDATISLLGDVVSPYTCELFASKRDTEVDHIVALSEAHDSGLCRADAETKRRFPRDVANLTLASPSLNRSKGARDGADWEPEHNRCWFATRIVDVRNAYGLTIDRREADALETILAGCSSADGREPHCESRSVFRRVLLPVLGTAARKDNSR